jgi:hypothetical protein
MLNLFLTAAHCLRSVSPLHKSEDSLPKTLGHYSSFILFIFTRLQCFKIKADRCRPYRAVLIRLAIMGRFATLNPDTKDMVNAMLPAIAKAFQIDDVKEIIPEDIRMRAWDCERRDHIKDQTEDDPRNWGVQFLKELTAIARLNGGDLTAFQDMLRVKVEKHEEKHPWCRLADIKEIKAKLQNPNQESEDECDVDAFGSPISSSVDSYLEELVEPEIPKGSKRGRKPRNAEIYEARTQTKQRKRRFFLVLCHHLPH